MKDKELLTAIAGDDPRKHNDALKWLYSHPVVNAKIKEWVYATNLILAEPDDILQEAIVALNKSIRSGRFRGGSKVITYLLGICRNKLYDHFKKKSNLQYSEFLTMIGDDSLGYDPFAEGEEEALEKQRIEVLHQILEQLEEKCEEGIRLSHFRSMKMDIIAEKLGLKNAGQARKKVSRCRTYLRKLIEEHPRFEELFGEFVSKS